MSNQSELSPQNWTPDEIVDALVFYDIGVPIDAIEAARCQRDAVIPLLIQRFQNATQKVREKYNEDPADDFVFDFDELDISPLIALCLLLEFRSKEALPAILSTISEPPPVSEALLDDAITEILPYVVPTLAHDRLDEILALVRDDRISTWAQLALLDGIKRLYVAGLRTREEVIALFTDLLREVMMQQDVERVTNILIQLTDLYPRECYDLIKTAFEEGLVEESDLDLEEFELALCEDMEVALEDVKNSYPAYLVDTIELLNEWCSFEDDEWGEDIEFDEDFEDEELDEEWVDAWNNVLSPMAPSSFDDRDEAAMQAGTIRNEAAHVGRNEPCPCGSGKKFKKCCGSRTKG